MAVLKSDYRDDNSKTNRSLAPGVILGTICTETTYSASPTTGLESHTGEMCEQLTSEGQRTTLGAGLLLTLVGAGPPAMHC